jgi:tetratricopeptide (TPR) repeat protein
LKITSCSNDNIDKTFDRVEKIVVRNPDSALILLNSIGVHPLKMTHERYAKYIVLSMYASDLTDMDILSDTSIVYARDYLKTINNPKYLAYAEYYLGRIYQAHGDGEQAMKSYLDAKKIAENVDDDNIKGLIMSRIGQLYCDLREYQDAIDNFKSALKHFNKSQDNYKRKITVLNNIGTNFVLAYTKDKAIRNSKLIDSAMIYYNEALLSARTAQDSADVIQNTGMIYLVIKEFSNAKQQLFRALKLNSDSNSQNSIYLNISTVYEVENLIDSAIHFAELSLNFVKQNDIRSMVANYKTLSRLEEKNGNCCKAQYYNTLLSGKNIKLFCNTLYFISI